MTTTNLDWSDLAAGYAVLTLFFAAGQWLENRRFGRAGEFWAPVWWVALAWPWLLIVVALATDQTKRPK